MPDVSDQAAGPDSGPADRCGTCHKGRKAIEGCSRIECARRPKNPVGIPDRRGFPLLSDEWQPPDEI